ncbi:MAG TPA: hypothetical protein VF623_06530 [Segetibacter sp.]|jgi:hypothetical protein
MNATFYHRFKISGDHRYYCETCILCMCFDKDGNSVTVASCDGSLGAMRYGNPEMSSVV